MRATLLAAAAVAAVMIAPSLTVTANADEVVVSPPGPRVEEHRGPAVIEEHRRPGVVIEETQGRRRDCVTHSESTTHNGTTVTQSERDCAR